MRMDKTTSQNSHKKSEQAVDKTKIDEASTDLNTKETERGGSIASLVTFIGTRQLSVAHSEFSDITPGALSVARAVELARRIEAALNSIDHREEAWNRNQREIHSHFET